MHGLPHRFYCYLWAKQHPVDVNRPGLQENLNVIVVTKFLNWVGTHQLVKFYWTRVSVYQKTRACVSEGITTTPINPSTGWKKTRTSREDCWSDPDQRTHPNVSQTIKHIESWRFINFAAVSPEQNTFRLRMFPSGCEGPPFERHVKFHCFKKCISNCWHG